MCKYGLKMGDKNKQSISKVFFEKPSETQKTTVNNCTGLLETKTYVKDVQTF